MNMVPSPLAVAVCIREIGNYPEQRERFFSSNDGRLVRS